MITRRNFLLATSLGPAHLLAGCRSDAERTAGAPLAARSAAAPPVPPDPAPCGSGARGMSTLPPKKPPLHPDSLSRFVDPLPIPDVLAPAELRPDPERPGRKIPFFRIEMRAAEVKIHRDVPATRAWTYGGSMPGPTLEVRSGVGALVEWHNALPERHFLPIDHGLCGAGTDVPEVRTAVHVHGARVPPESDGYPEDWYPPGASAVHHYPARQSAATLWYHDHAMGIERLNQYAGLFGVFLVRDDVEASLALPEGAYEVPLVLTDRLFDEEGQLVYPTSGVAEAPWVSEVYGDALLVNGKLSPFLDVEPRPYRFRVVNASNARFYYLSLSEAESLLQLGTEQGFLARPVALRTLTLAPGERADVAVDFTKLAGRSIVLKSQAFGLVQFRVKGRASTSSARIPDALVQPPHADEKKALRTRLLTLDEYEDPKTHAMLMLLNGSRFRDPVTECPLKDSVEIWSLMNLTEDVHPIHLHLVRFRILDRQPFDADEYRTSRTMVLMGKPVPPGPDEAGLKDTVRADPGMITRILVHFDGYAGRYVWHCHVLEHAANEMMRPFDVVERMPCPPAPPPVLNSAPHHHTAGAGRRTPG
ncbi:MAG TPA: multicopper oxidase domain-containing protein [Polyangiaceae bacterium]|nr:multicopper oxidase domain-containing protein [Polyangiaceae bacterium]